MQRGKIKTFALQQYRLFLTNMKSDDRISRVAITWRTGIGRKAGHTGEDASPLRSELCCRYMIAHDELDGLLGAFRRRRKSATNASSIKSSCRFSLLKGSTSLWLTLHMKLALHARVSRTIMDVNPAGRAESSVIASRPMRLACSLSSPWEIQLTTSSVEDVFIPVVGMTGAGKTTFICTCTQEKPLKSGGSLSSCEFYGPSM